MISLSNYFHTGNFLYKRENRTAPAYVRARLFRRVKWLGTREIVYDVSVVQSVARAFSEIDTRDWIARIKKLAQIEELL